MQKKDTVWVIGASGGLGLATARAFAADGWKVVAGARSMTASAAEASSADIFRLPLDVTDEASCDRFAREALARSPQVDAVVCCAAQLVLGSCENTSIAELSKILDVNLLGAVRMVQRALPAMRAQKRGRIILFSSINGLLGIPFQSAYTASKHALEGYAECLAMETRAMGIQVCLVEPGDHRGGGKHTRLHAVMETDTSPYYQAYTSACGVIHRDEENGLCPHRLGHRVVKNVNRKRMHFKLRVAKADQHLAVWLHDLLPSWANQRILSRYYHVSQ